MIRLALRILRRPHRWLRMAASLTALVTNLKQLTEVTNPSGYPITAHKTRAEQLAHLVAMEVHQLHEHLGLNHAPPGWVICRHCGGLGDDSRQPGRAKWRFANEVPASDWLCCAACTGIGARPDDNEVYSR